ncbi:DNA polymerase III subunit delta [Portibacter lacus]|uniref:DNA polymerase III subunit delta n=1 Tax=Portibacter lacus TaxID=1099794 RepID=A0AA37WD68_9BACT|nr:DNA polymerase III subunit delta [Portibacter lacus]GLR15582.1 DNA polymerase III subunit delta [Portibacter lacus]
MESRDILKELKAGVYKPIYFLSGEEPYYIDQISDYIEDHILDEGGKAFNQVILYGKEVDFKTVVDNARQFPMMAPYRVIIIKEAQEMKSLTSLQSYIENPSPQTILVINYKYKKVDKRTGFAKAIKANAVLLETKKIYDNQLPGYIDQIAKSNDLKIDQKANVLLATYIGADLSKINNEIGKLALRLEKGETINAQHIEEFVGISKDYNIFELQNALGKRDKVVSFRIVEYFASNEKKNPLIVSINSLYGYFTKVWQTQSLSSLDDKSLASKIGVFSSFFMKDYRLAARNYSKDKLKRILLDLQEYDGYSKGVDRRNPDQGDLLKELVFKILN